MARTVAIIQSRFASTRLPGKALADIGGKPLLQHVIERVQKAKLVDTVVVATGTDPSNWPIEHLCRFPKVICVRGSDNDVLDRFYNVAGMAGGVDVVVVRISGDCPLIDPLEIDNVIRFREVYDYAYASNCHPPRLPDGLDVEVMTYQALRDAHMEATLPSDREHVTPWLRRSLPKSDWGSMDHMPDLSQWRLCVDEQADLDLMRLLWSEIGPGITWQLAVKYLQAHPEAARLNSGIVRNAGYAKSLEGDNV
jgi:spore coat polysaccharide biosynthesis protein SpsF (cytidylyltransferase family)